VSYTLCTIVSVIFGYPHLLARVQICQQKASLVLFLALKITRRVSVGAAQRPRVFPYPGLLKVVIPVICRTTFEQILSYSCVKSRTSKKNGQFNVHPSCAPQGLRFLKVPILGIWPKAGESWHILVGGQVVNEHESSERLDRKIGPAFFMIIMFPFLFFKREGKKKKLLFWHIWTRVRRWVYNVEFTAAVNSTFYRGWGYPKRTETMAHSV
jgi:hypothetical protein